MEPVKNERERMLNYVFTTAIEGGIDYWANVTAYKWSAPSEKEFGGITESRDFYADITDSTDDIPGVYRIDRKVISRGIRAAYKYMAENVGEYGEYQRLAIRDLNYGRWDDVDYDATTADIIVQFGLFGELVYG